MSDPNIYGGEKPWGERWWEIPIIFGQELLFSLPDAISELAELELGEGITDAASGSEDVSGAPPDFRAFERMLGKALSWEDTIHDAFIKIVRVALAARYRMTVQTLKDHEKMIEKLVDQMEADPALRKQALYLVFLFCHQAI